MSGHFSPVTSGHKFPSGSFKITRSWTGKEVKGWSLADLIKQLKEAVGKVYTGYKGGDYTMTEDTPLWVANYGETGSTAITGVLDQGWCVLIVTDNKESL